MGRSLIATTDSASTARQRRYVRFRRTPSRVRLWAANNRRGKPVAMTTTRGINALHKLDENVPTRFIWSLTLLATLGGFLFGYDTANIGAALQFIPYSLNSFGTGYLVAGASLGAAAGALLAGPVSDRFGRKKLLVADALIY